VGGGATVLSAVKEGIWWDRTSFRGLETYSARFSIDENIHSVNSEKLIGELYVKNEHKSDFESAI